MAITINSPTTANIKDWTTYNTTQYSLSVTVGGTIREILDILIKVNGTIIASKYDTTPTTTFTFDSTIRTALYNALASGTTLSGVVSIEAFTRNADGTNPASVALTGGTVTVNARNTFTLSTPTNANPIDLDAADPTNIYFSAISRPHTAFYTKIKTYVNNTFTWLRYGYGTSMSIDVKTYSYETDMAAAMGGVSPRDIRFDMITQIKCGSNYIDLPYSQLTSGTLKNSFTVTGGVVKSFYLPSTIDAADFTIQSGMTIPFTLTPDADTAPDNHTLELKIAGTSVLTRSGSSIANPIVPTAGEITLMLNAIPNSSTATAVLYCTTYKGAVNVGTTNSGNKTATVSASYVCSLTGITVSEATTSPAVASLIGKYVQSISKLSVVLNGATPSAGATIASYEIILDGKPAFTTASFTTDVLTNAGTGKTISVKFTDTRGRVYYNATQATYDVLAYAKPTITLFDVQRASDTTGSENPIGTYAKYIITAAVSSLINGTEKNALKYQIFYKELPSGTEANYALTTPGGLTFNTYKTYNTPDFYVYPINKSYSVRLEITDVLGQKTTSNDTLPFGKVLMDWGEDNVGIGKVYSGTGTIDVATDANGVSINADGKVLSAGVEVIKRLDIIVTDFDAIDPTTLTQGRTYTFNTGFQAANRPSAANYYSGILTVHGISQKYATIMMTGTTDGYIYTRMFNGTTWGNWSKVFTELTDGSGSGLDADLVDAYQLKGNANSISQDGILSNGNTGLIGDACLYYKATSTTIANTTEVQVPVDTLEFNTNTALYTIASGVITVKKAGVYQIIGFLRSNSGTAGGRMNTAIWKNATAWSPVSGGTQYILGTIPQVASQPSGVAMPIVLKLNANDTITLSAYTTGAGVTIGSSIISNFLSITKIG